MKIIYDEVERIVLVNGGLIIWDEEICDSVLDILEEYYPEVPMEYRMNILRFFQKFEKNA